MDKVLRNLLRLIDHLLTHHNDVQEISLSNTDFSWFTDCSHFKGGSGKCCANYSIATSFDVVEAASLLMATTLAKDKIINIYANSRYAVGIAHNFKMLWKLHGLLTSSGNKI